MGDLTAAGRSSQPFDDRDVRLTAAPAHGPLPHSQPFDDRDVRLTAALAHGPLPHRPPSHRSARGGLPGFGRLRLPPAGRSRHPAAAHSQPFDDRDVRLTAALAHGPLPHRPPSHRSARGGLPGFGRLRPT
ncbi:hypothetical protein SVEN_1663, partial [Streptomyces venezuelae ATCC 10712]